LEVKPSNKNPKPVETPNFFFNFAALVQGKSFWAPINIMPTRFMRCKTRVLAAAGACLLACSSSSMIQPTQGEIVWSLDADSISGGHASSSSGELNASFVGFGEISSSYVDVARVGGALRFNDTQALTATLPTSYDLSAGTLSFWFQPEFDSATTTVVHDLLILGQGAFHSLPAPPPPPLQPPSFTTFFYSWRFARGVLLGSPTMLCDVIIAMTELIVKVLQSRSAIGIHTVARVEAQPYM
jgi:hypothetical protein